MFILQRWVSGKRLKKIIIFGFRFRSNINVPLHLRLIHTAWFFLNATACFFTCDFVKLFTQCDCDLYRYILESHITIAQNRYETHSMSDIAHTNVTGIWQSHHMNSLRDIHTTHFSNSSRIHRNRTVWTSLESHYKPFVARHKSQSQLHRVKSPLSQTIFHGIERRGHGLILSNFPIHFLRVTKATYHIHLIAGSLESANSSILATRNLFKDFGGEKNQDFMIIRWPISWFAYQWRHFTTSRDSMWTTFTTSFFFNFSFPSSKEEIKLNLF